MLDAVDLLNQSASKTLLRLMLYRSMNSKRPAPPPSSMRDSIDSPTASAGITDPAAATSSAPANTADAENASAS
jgi:hypothetical protein